MPNVPRTPQPPKRLRSITLLGCLLACLPAAAEPGPASVDLVQRLLLRRTSSRFLVCAHRGDFYRRPNNSPASIEQAIRRGADLVEIDIQATADRQCVVAHDPWPRKKTLAQWRAGGKGLTTMADALAVVRRRAVVILDIKVPDVTPVINEMRRLGASDHCIVYTPYYHDLRKLDPTCYVMVRAHTAGDVYAFAKVPDKKIVLVHGDYRWMTRNLVAVTRRSGRRAFVNSYKLDPFKERFGAGRSVAQVFRRGIDVAQTNHVASAVATRKRFTRLR